MDFTLTSTAFEHEGMIPLKYSCDSADVSPPLRWENAPKGVKSFALVCDDPDAPKGVFDHWVLYNLPQNATSLSENVPKDEQLPNGAIQGTNSFGRIGYNGPCPPGGTHRYYFRLYALDREVDLRPGARKKDLEQAMESSILGVAELMGRYAR